MSGGAGRPAEARTLDHRQPDPPAGAARAGPGLAPPWPDHPGPRPRLLPLGDEREQIEFCGRIEREGLNVRQTRRSSQETIDAADIEAPWGSRAGGSSLPPQRAAAIGTPPKRTRSPRAKSEHLIALEQEIRTALGMKVKITHNAAAAASSSSNSAAMRSSNG